MICKKCKSVRRGRPHPSGKCIACRGEKPVQRKPAAKAKRSSKSKRA